MKSLRIFAGCFLGIILLLTVCNAGLLKEPVKNLSQETADFTAFRDEVQEAYTGDGVFLKNAFVDINGLFSRLTGRRMINNTLLMNNGMLNSAGVPRLEMSEIAAELAAFSEDLAGMGIPFLYVQAPYKMDAESTLLPQGASNYANANADEMVAMLEAAEVNVLDLRPELAETVEDIERNFFRTDHHWAAAGAFSAYQLVAPRLQTLLGDTADVGKYLDEGSWEAHTRKDWFLGSQGKRVGRFFAGVDDLTWYTPNFATEMSCAVPRHRNLYRGDFTAANIRQQYTEGKPDYFGTNPYCVYIGGDYPLVQHRNEGAPSDRKLLLIKDSFMLPMQSFLSTVYREIDVVDPRHFKECSVAEYIYRTRPDAVMLMVNPTLFGTKSFFQYGSEQLADIAAKSVLDETPLPGPADVEIEASDSAYQYETAYDGMEPGTAYTLAFEDVSIRTGEADCVAAALYDRATNTVLSSGVFDIEYCRGNGGFRWMFKTPESGYEDMEVLLYSGHPGATQGVSVAYRGVELHKGYAPEE